ncbi:hypothetical protein BH09PSE6_BH09PSE6_29820 [soil metagenome]
MQRRNLLRAAAAATALPALSACGGGGSGDDDPSTGTGITGFSADKTTYFVGETVQLSATFTGSGTIEPGALPITSGTPLSVVISGPTTYVLTTTATGSSSSTRSLSVPATYRNTYNSIGICAARAGQREATLADRVLLIGGQSVINAQSLPAQVLQYNPSSEVFAAAGNLLTGRFAHSATPIPATGSTTTLTRVMVFGGLQDDAGVAIAEVFDSASGSSRATTTQPRDARSGHSALALNDRRVLLTGGTNGGIALASADLFDPAGETFTRLTSTLSVGRTGHATAMLRDGSVLIYGGLTQSGRAAPPERYDPALQAFTSFGLPDVDLDVCILPTVLTLSSGDVLIVGGTDANGAPRGKIVRASLSGTQVVFALQGTLRTARAAPTATLLRDGRVFITGGSGDTTLRGLATTEVIGTDGGLSAGPVMSAGRYLHTASLTSTGKLLIAGGIDASGNTVSSSADLLG